MSTSSLQYFSLESEFTLMCNRIAEELEEPATWLEPRTRLLPATTVFSDLTLLSLPPALTFSVLELLN